MTARTDRPCDSLGCNVFHIAEDCPLTPGATSPMNARRSAPDAVATDTLLYIALRPSIRRLINSWLPNSTDTGEKGIVPGLSPYLRYALIFNWGVTTGTTTRSTAAFFFFTLCNQFGPHKSSEYPVVFCKACKMKGHLMGSPDCRLADKECLSCHQKGHLMADCPFYICDVCGKQGHLQMKGHQCPFV